MLSRLFRLIVALLALAGLAAASAGVWFMKDGISAKPQPGGLETSVARRLRSLAIPRAAAERANPVTASAEVVADGMAHYADHCANCHGNDGSGDTEMGRGLYPKAPDMRLAVTQSLSDGTLFYIIEHGVRLTGMPGWGTGTDEGEQSSWGLVHFIRHLPALTEAEKLEMEELNPKSQAEWQEAEEIQQFLEGDSDTADQPAPAPAPPHKHR